LKASNRTMKPSTQLCKIILAFKLCHLSNSFGFMPGNQLSSRSPSLQRNSAHVLRAEGGPPQYDKTYGKIATVETVGLGSAMIHVECDEPTGYQPGHVLALEIEHNKDETSDTNAKNSQDAANNGGWMRGPYTISRATENSFDVLMRVVGDKSKTFSLASTGTSVRFGGKFHTPIIDGIQKDSTKRVVLLSTGVGVGPCVGAIEDALKDTSFPPIELYASYKTKEEVVYSEYLDGMAANHATKFLWKPFITSDTGRVSATVDNVKIVAGAPLSSSNDLSLTDTHYHLIGNAQMVKEWKSGLEKAGVPDEKVTVESYFNGKMAPNQDAIDNISTVIAASFSKVIA